MAIIQTVVMLCKVVLIVTTIVRRLINVHSHQFHSIYDVMSCFFELYSRGSHRKMKAEIQTSLNFDSQPLV